MTYELVRKLKDAGFPYPENWESIRWLNSDPHDRNRDDRVYLPSLSELIEACGEEFCLYKDAEGWIAYNGFPGNAYERHEGSTPEEAVARLWLALQSAA